MEIFKWKNTITTLRNSIDRTIEMTKPEQKREHILGKNKTKKNKSTRDCWVCTEDIKFVW